MSLLKFLLLTALVFNSVKKNVPLYCPHAIFLLPTTISRSVVTCTSTSSNPLLSAWVCGGNFRPQARSLYITDRINKARTHAAFSLTVILVLSIVFLILSLQEVRLVESCIILVLMYAGSRSKKFSFSSLNLDVT